MFKDYLRDSIIKELQICKRLASKIPADKMSFKHKEDVRSINELLQYLSYIGTGMIRYWYRSEPADFSTFYTAMRAASPKINTPEDFMQAMDAQIELTKKLFENITEADLHDKIVDHASGVKTPLGEAILENVIKWLAAYKLQLFSLIKMSTAQKLSTPDAWRVMDITA